MAKEFDKLFDVLECPEELKVNQAAFYLTGEADDWWANSKTRLLKQTEGFLGWDMFKRAMRDKFYPLHVRKDKLNEFEMGNLTVDEYYHKFLQKLFARTCFSETFKNKVCKKKIKPCKSAFNLVWVQYNKVYNLFMTFLFS